MCVVHRPKNTLRTINKVPESMQLNNALNTAIGTFNTTAHSKTSATRNEHRCSDALSRRADEVGISGTSIRFTRFDGRKKSVANDMKRFSSPSRKHPRGFQNTLFIPSKSKDVPVYHPNDQKDQFFLPGTPMEKPSETPKPCPRASRCPQKSNPHGICLSAPVFLTILTPRIKVL